VKSASAAETFARDLGGLYRARQMYPSGNVQVRNAAERACASLGRVGETVRVASLGAQIVVQDQVLDPPPRATRNLLEALRVLGREGLRVAPEVRPEELVAWIEGVFGGTLEDRGPVETGSYQLEVSQPPAGQVSTAAVGYLSLTSGAGEALDELGRGRAGGLLRAREIVDAIVSQLVVGRELFQPIAELKGHDAYTFTHALNVAVLSSALGRALGLSGPALDRLTLAALCHDVGKEKVPPEILNKPGPLEPAEREVMDRHASEGARALLGISAPLDPLLPVVAFQHHRGARGEGYPREPDTGPPHPLSLVVAVADVFDALRTVRPYRPARSPEVAVNVLLAALRDGALVAGHVSAFLRLTGFLGPGCRVQLEQGEPAVVVAAGGDPLRPRLQVEGEGGGGTVDLEELPWVGIREVLEVSPEGRG
jgi:HD-GYP domain-containing protein (c-di-GMP phosphodiesterase class II)